MRFQFRNFATDRGQRHAEATPRGRQISFIDNGDKDRHGFQTIHRILSNYGRLILNLMGLSFHMQGTTLLSEALRRGMSLQKSEKPRSRRVP
jgi:hypothetical protein